MERVGMKRRVSYITGLVINFGLVSNLLLFEKPSILEITNRFL